MKICFLIQTCDKYEFLWEGLELAWDLNWEWKNWNPEVYVLTEEKDFPSSRFKTLKFGKLEGGPKNFSSRLTRALVHLKEMQYDTVFYLQDDFWPMMKMNTEIFSEALKFFERSNASCLHVNEYCPWYEYTLEKVDEEILGEDLWKFRMGSRFYYNHQASFWKIEDLLSIQAVGEEPYENECNGTIRAWEKNLQIYFLNHAWYKAAYINQKGTLLPVAQDLVRDWKWKNVIKKINFLNESHN
jgi:hypothetical protein